MVHLTTACILILSIFYSWLTPHLEAKSRTSVASKKSLYDVSLGIQRYKQKKWKKKHRTTLQMMEIAGLTDDLKDCKKGPFTLFLPHNQRWKKLSSVEYRRLLHKKNRAKLVQLMSHHIVKGVASVQEAKSGDNMRSIEGSKIEWDINGKGKKLNKIDPRVSPAMRKNGAWINKPRDIMACNGVVHGINSILLPKGFKF